MKHAGVAALDQIENVLAQMRDLAKDKSLKSSRLIEKKRGVFYLGSTAFAHFHEDGEASVSLHGDLKVGKDWQRFRLDSKSEQSKFVQAVRQQLLK